MSDTLQTVDLFNKTSLNIDFVEVSTIQADDELILPSTSNQVSIGPNNLITVNFDTSGPKRTLTIPNTGGNASFLMSTGNQSISGTETFNGNVTMSANVSITNPDGTFTVAPATTFNNSITENGNITINGNINQSGNLNVDGDTILTGSLT